MRILFDQGVPAPLREYLTEAEVTTCYEKGWSNLSNGDLPGKAGSEFDVFVTTDKNLRYQQNLEGRRIAILVLPTTRWPQLKLHATALSERIRTLSAQSYLEWELPANGNAD